MKKLLALTVAISVALGLMAGPAAATDRQPILPGAVHADGTWTYQDAHVEHHTADYGLIADVGDGSITVVRPDLVRVTVPLPDTACVRIGGIASEIGNLHRGMRAVVFARVADDGTSSVRVVRAGVPLVRPDQPGCGLLTGAIHGDVKLTYRDGSTRSFSVDRGQVDSVDGGEILMTRPDGTQLQTSVDQDTRFRGINSLGDLIGRQAMVVSERIADALIAKTVRALMV
jgi:hypothetical protein